MAIIEKWKVQYKNALRGKLLKESFNMDSFMDEYDNGIDKINTVYNYIESHLKNRNFGTLKTSTDLMNHINQVAKQLLGVDDFNMEMPDEYEAVKERVKELLLKLKESIIIKENRDKIERLAPGKQYMFYDGGESFYMNYVGVSSAGNFEFKLSDTGKAVFLNQNDVTDYVYPSNLKESKQLNETSFTIPSPQVILNYGEQDIVKGIKELFKKYDGFTLEKIQALGDNEYYNVNAVYDLNDDMNDLEFKRYTIGQTIHKFRLDFFSDLSTIFPIVNANLGAYEFVKGNDKVKFVITLLLSKTNNREWVSGQYKKKDTKSGKAILDVLKKRDLTEGK